MTYQLIEQSDVHANIICPICAQAVVDWSQEQYIQPCEHTLYIAMDLGFEFIADRFETTLQRSVDDLHEDPETNIFAALNAASYPITTVIRADLGLPDLHRYVGFSSQ